MRDNKDRIRMSILNGCFIHTAGILFIWFAAMRNEAGYPQRAFIWYVLIPIILNAVSLVILGCLNKPGKNGWISPAVYKQVMALLYVLTCCANYILLRKFDLSFLIMVLPVIVLFLEHRSERNIPQVLILIAFYELMQFLPDMLPGEPPVFPGPRSQLMFGIYISICIMILLWETKDAYAYSFKEKEVSDLKFNAQREFILKKNQDVRGAIHNVKGTGEMILRHNASDACADQVVRVMDACDRIIDLVDRILETSRAELYNKNLSVHEHREEEERYPAGDGNILYAPGAYILVADDSAESLKLTRVLLARTGMKLDTVLTGSEALKMISYNYYNLIVLDSVLSDMTAIQIRRSMKGGNGVNADTPVIVCTAADLNEVMDMYLSEGFADVVRKPLSGEQIERVIEKHLPARLLSKRYP